MKALEIKTSMLFNLRFGNNTILSCFFFFFLTIDFDVLIPVVVAQIFNPIAEVAIFKVTIYFHVNQEFLIFQLIILL